MKQEVFEREMKRFAIDYYLDQINVHRREMEEGILTKEDYQERVNFFSYWIRKVQGFDSDIPQTEKA